MNKPFQDHVSQIALQKGIQGNTTKEHLDALKVHSHETVRSDVTKPVKRWVYSALPVPKPGESELIEVRAPIDDMAVLRASVKTKEEGTDVIARELRRALATALAGQLNNSDRMQVRVEGKEVVASLVISNPPVPDPEEGSDPEPAS